MYYYRIDFAKLVTNVDVFLMAKSRDGMAITKSLTAVGGLIYGAVGGPYRVEDVHDKEPTQYWQQRTLNSEAENITWCNVGFKIRGDLTGSSRCCMNLRQMTPSLDVHVVRRSSLAMVWSPTLADGEGGPGWPGGLVGERTGGRARTGGRVGGRPAGRTGAIN